MLCTLNQSSTGPATGAAVNTLFSAFQYILTSQYLVEDHWEPSADIKDCDTFHFIIVGAGSAGCVVANRLTENINWNVLLIEAGGDPPIESYVPQFYKKLFNSPLDWQYKTTPTGRIHNAMVGETLHWPRGKVLGGSSAINGMTYFRGLDSDSREWYDQGNPEWHEDIVREYYRKAESVQDQELLNVPDARNFYGVNGPQIINTVNYTRTDIIKNILDVYKSLGFKIRKDLQLANLTGAGKSKVTAYNGKRASTATAYLSSIQNRENVKILKNAVVTKLLINNRSEVYGIELQYSGKMIRVFALIEVVLSAGSINSPQLLMLSGIGPKNALEAVNIPCVVDLPAVGQNLQDHITIPVPVFTEGVISETERRQFLDVALYLFNRTGYLAQTYPNVIAFYSRNDSHFQPEFQLHLRYESKNSSFAKDYYSIYKTPISVPMIKLAEEYDLYIFQFNLLKPYSRGNITLKSNSPFDYPNIFPNYFNDPRDLQKTAEGLQMLENLTKSEYFKRINGFFARYEWPQCKSYPLNSIEYWKCIAPNIVLTIYHPVGTCSMGTDPKLSVVDSRLRVHSVKGLRVIDASVMPNITSCNTNGPTIMIGERGADLIKEDYKNL